MSPARRRPVADQLAPDAARLRAAGTAAVSRKLRSLLSEQPRSLAQLSEEAGLGESTVGRICRGSVEPSLSEMVALAAVFKLGSIEELVGPFATQRLVYEASDRPSSGQDDA